MFFFALLDEIDVLVWQPSDFRCISRVCTREIRPDVLCRILNFVDAI